MYLAAAGPADRPAGAVVALAVGRTVLQVFAGSRTPAGRATQPESTVGEYGVNWPVG